MHNTESVNLTTAQGISYHLPHNKAFRDAFACLSAAGVCELNSDYWERESKAFDLTNADHYFEYMKA